LKKVYFISGLGADKRAFSFLDLSFCEPVFIDWITPLKNESLQSYALRLKEQIKEPGPIIVGVSFGGMLATEIAKTDPSIKAIIISSNRIKKEFPKLLLIGKYIPVYKWVPSSLLKKAAFVRKMFFAPTGEHQKKIFRQILNDSDINFTKWAVYAIMHWQNNIVPENVIHIHGTSDKLLPYRLVKADYTIQKGSHLMIMNHYNEISDLLKKLIKDP
jgi:pimeloyl-ACP methyl ester carboxylesterase